MVKNDALFSYVAPGNLFAWALIPLRYCMPLKQFVLLNRTVIKVTHCPLLFLIYVYERYYLAPSMYEPTDLVENPGRSRHRSFSFGDPASRTALFSPSIRLREESIAGFQKDRALEEVFRRVPDPIALRTQRRNERRKTQNAIRSWMDQHEAGFHSPQNYSTIDSRIENDWQRRSSMTRDKPRRFPRQFSDVRSAASDPADFISDAPYPVGPEFYREGVSRRDYARHIKENTDGDGDGDDELVTNDEEEEDNVTHNMAGDPAEAIEDYFTTPVAARFSSVDFALPSTSQRSTSSPRPATARRNPLHNRTLSTNTILYAPSEEQQTQSSSSTSPGPSSQPRSRPLSMKPTPTVTPTNGRRSPRRSVYVTAATGRPRPDMIRTPPGRMALALDIPSRKTTGRGSSSADLDVSSEINADMAANEAFGAVPSSLGAQRAMATAMMSKSAQTSEGNRMSRLMLAKMKTLEESLGDVVREMRVLRSAVPSTRNNSADDGSGGSEKPKTASGSGSNSLGSPRTAVLHVAGRERPGPSVSRTTTMRTPEQRTLMRRRSTKEWVGEGPMPRTGVDKGKSKEQVGSQIGKEESDDYDNSGHGRGASGRLGGSF